jgi:hypothetical protein
MQFKPAVLSVVFAMLLGSVPAPAYAVYAEGPNGMVASSYCWTAYADGQPVDHMCNTIYTNADSGAYYGTEFDALYYWGGSKWVEDLGMITVNGDWNGYVKVNRAGTKIVTDAFHCVGDIQTNRTEAAKAAMQIAQNAQLFTTGAYPVGQKITMYMEGGDSQVFTKSAPGINIFLTASPCKPAK